MPAAQRTARNGNGDARAAWAEHFAGIERFRRTGRIEPEPPRDDNLQAVLDTAPELLGIEPFPTIDLERYARDGIPPIEWLREPWIAREDVGIGYGPPYIGKSTWMMQLAFAIAAGTPFCGSPAAEPAPVVVVDGEAGERSIARLALLCGPPVPALHIVSASGQLSLLDPDAVRRLQRTASDLRPALIVVDSVSTTFGLNNENDSAEVRRAMEELFILRDKFGCATLAIHHVGKSPVDGRNARSALERLRGSSAFAAMASLAIRFEAAPNGKALDVEIAKARDRDLRGYVRRVEVVPNGRYIALANLGDPAVTENALESELDEVSRAVVELFPEPGRRKTRGQVVEALSAKHSAKAVDRALAHLAGIDRLDRPSHGVYCAPTFPPASFPWEMPGNGET